MLILAAPVGSQQVLTGRIEHSASLPAVDPEWKVGKKFDPEKLPLTGSQSAFWWRVPDWLAGTWRTYGKVKRLSFKDLEHTELAQGFDALDIKYPDSEVIGFQQDSYGSVWTCVPTPYVGRTEQGDKINISIIYSATPVDLADDQVVVKFLATTLSLDKAKGRIVSVTQRESLQTYRPIENGKVLVQASMKFFNEDGIARYESTVLSQSRQHEPFRESPYLPVSGEVPTLIDMRKSFDNFLHTRQMDALIPDRAPLPVPKHYKMITL